MPVRRRDAKVDFNGQIAAVKARIRLLRSFDQIHHSYQGYVLVLDGTVDGALAEELRVAVGPKTHEQHQFHIGDQLTGKAVAVADPDTEWASWYKVSELRVLSRGTADQDVPPNPEGGVAPPLPEYRERGHRRLDRSTYEAHCQRCPFGLVMATQIIIDQWNPSHVRWRYETHCYGPRDCSRYRPGKPYCVQGRKSNMVWVDDDVEREAREQRERT